MKRVLSVLLSLCLMVSLATSAMAAPAKTSGAASTLRLESTEGTVQLKNAAGKTLKATNGARLYNGYELSTQKASYAYVSLDETKAVKLDASTSSEVFQSGKKLELKVNSGQIFFNVSAPLKSDESLTIRTSTIVTGVRGTCGWVETMDRHTTRVPLLEGMLTVTSMDPVTKSQRTTTIVGGQTATVVYHGAEQDLASETPIEDETIQDLIEEGVIRDEHIILEETGLTVEELQEEDVPGAVAVEVKKDPVLQEKIEKNTPLSVPEIIGDAEERVEAEETQAETKDADIQDTLEDLGAEVVDPVFEEETPQEPASGGGSSTPDPEEPAEPEQPAEYGISVSCVDTMNDEVFYSYEIVGLECDPYTIREDEFLGYTLDYVEGDALTGTLDGNKTVTFYYTRGWIELDDPATADLETALNTVGFAPISITNANQTNDLDLVAASGGVLSREVDIESGDVYINQGDTMTLDEGGALYVTSASLTNYGTLVANSTLEVSSGGEINNAGEMSGSVGITHGGAVLNSGTFTGSLGLWGNPCVFSNTGSCTLTGVSSSGEGGDISSSGTLNITGPVSTKSLSITGGTATISENGSVTVSADSEMTVSGAGTTVTNNGAISIDGTFSLGADILDNHGTVTLGETCVIGDGGSAITNYGTVINNSDSLTPVSIGLTNKDGGEYIDNTIGEMYMLVLNSSGRATAWGAIPSPYNLDPGENPFYDSDTQSETWLSGYTYMVHSPQTGSVDTYGATLPAVTADNVNLDLNGQTLHLSQTLTLQGGSLTVRDSGTNGEITSSADYTVNVNGGNFVLESGSVVNTSNSAITGSIGADPASTITINGGSVYGSVYGIYTSVPSDPSIAPVTITVNGTDYTDTIIVDGGENFPVSGGSGAIAHAHGGGSGD